ncbi:MAG: hypothetical protein ACLR4Z_01400 [Butyricicoccaceae bacterium]
MDEYKSVLMKQRKDMNANLNTLPVRVDECSRMVAELESLDFAAAHSESDRLQAERERVQGELVKLANNTLAAQARNEAGRCKISSRELETENNAHLASQRVPVDDKTAGAEPCAFERRQDVDRLQRTIDHEKQYIADGETRLNDYRARWRAIDAEEFTETVCPDLPSAAAGRAGCRGARSLCRLSAAAQGRTLRGQQAGQAGHCRRTGAPCECRNYAEKRTGRGAEAQIALDGYTPPVITEPENLPDYDRRKGAILMLIADADKRIDRLSGDTAAEKSRLEAEHAELTRRKLESDAVLAKEQTLS